MSTWIPNTDDPKTSLRRATPSEYGRVRTYHSTDSAQGAVGSHQGRCLRLAL
jgi:hypothetical protein